MHTPFFTQVFLEHSLGLYGFPPCIGYHDPVLGSFPSETPFRAGHASISPGLNEPGTDESKRTPKPGVAGVASACLLVCMWRVAASLLRARLSPPLSGTIFALTSPAPLEPRTDAYAARSSA